MVIEHQALVAMKRQCLVSEIRKYSSQHGGKIVKSHVTWHTEKIAEEVDIHVQGYGHRWRYWFSASGTYEPLWNQELGKMFASEKELVHGHLADVIRWTDQPGGHGNASRLFVQSSL